MYIFIPSTHRHDKIDRGPLQDLTEEVRGRHKVHYVVPDGEGLSYREALPRDVGVITTAAKGIAQTRHIIGLHCRDRVVDHFLMLDDDIRFLVRRDEDDWRLRGPNTDEVMEMLSAVDKSLLLYDHVGISAREGNNRIGTGGKSLRAENTRTLRALAYQTESFLSVEHGRVDVMEDFDVNLQILRQGGSNCCLHYWAQGQAMTNAPGGCSTYRTHAVHEKSAHKLAELHPGLVRLRQKTNKTDREGFGTRTEVTIQWKKAAKEGQS